MRKITNPLGWSQYWTHQKRPYHAYAVQWRQDNLSEIQALLPEVEMHHVGQVAFLRFAPGECQIISPNGWAVKGENGDVKIYSDKVFRIKYEAL